jgi:hypothetical protein
MRESPIFVRTYDLLQWLLQVTGNFPRSQRFVMARRIQDTAFDFQEALLEAGMGSEEVRTQHLARADIALAKLRFYLRLSTDLTWLTAGQHEHASRMVDEIGRLLGGWQRKERE